MLADRMARVEPSRLLELIAQGQALRRQGVAFTDLGPGQPDFPVPDLILDATARALREGHTYYSPVMGIPALREAVAERYNRRYGAAYSAANVMVTAGAKGALYHVMGAHLNPGDEVVIPAPYYASTPEIVKLWGGVPRFLPCRIEDGFLPDPGGIAALCGPRTRGIVLNSPSNPTGAVIPEPLLRDVASLAESKGLFVIVDECYDRYLYDGIGYATAPHVDPEARLPFYVAGSFSKTFSMTGYRLGYAVGPKEGIAAAGLIQSHSMNGAVTFAQFGGLAALAHEDELFAPILEDYARRREVLFEGLSSIPGVVCRKPDGAFYAFPEVRGLMERLGAADTDALAAILLADASVMAIPGGVLGLEGFMRFSFAVPEPQIREAVGRIAALAARASRG